MKTVNITPTWRGILPALRAIIEGAGPEGRAMAWEELQRMAELADQFVAINKEGETHGNPTA